MGTSTWTGVPATYMMPPSTTPASATSAAPATTTTTTNSTPPASGPEMRSRTANATRTVTTRGKAGSTTTTGAPNGHQHPSHAAAATAAPLSARKSQALDLSTVERRGQPTTARESPKRMRPYGLQEAPTFRPTPDEFKDPVEYIQRIAPEGRKYGMLKIIPPDSWKPGFCIDTERFHFRTRRQELNSVDGGTRANLNYLDQLSKFHKQQGTNLTRFPSVDKRPLDLYRLKKAVDVRGGFEKVCKHKKWAEIGRDLGYSGKIMSSLSTSLKNSYQRWLNPYEEYLRVAKPGLQMKLDHEHGGPPTMMTPSPASSPMKRSQPNTPASSSGPDPTPGTTTTTTTTTMAMRASAALNASLHQAGESDDHSRALPPSSSLSSASFTPVNGTAPAFAAAAAAAAANPHRSSFAPVNGLNGGSPRRTVPAAHDDGDDDVKGVDRADDADEGDDDDADDADEDGPSSRARRDGPPGLAYAKSPDRSPLGPTRPDGRLKRKLGRDSPDPSCAREGDVDPYDPAENGGRRSQRLKKDAPHTVAGSHMTLLRPHTPGIPGDNTGAGERCDACGAADDPDRLALCEGCDRAYHLDCLDPALKAMPGPDWNCARCLVGTGEYGFEDGGVYSLRQFQEKAHTFREAYFRTKTPFDPVLNRTRPVTEDDVEREFWRLVESLTETVEVEYGADIHSTTHGSGFPTVERRPLDPYSTDPWNLNMLPLHPDSLFRHIKSDISGMTVPWLYVGMCFSTFCWHNEDHYAYSANYQHFGATKTWYGIPAEDAERFEAAMRGAVPELFETQPDLLFQLVTLLPPDQLMRAGVRVYALDQRAGQFVVTFPQAYHAGFNHGFNFNEAVNFAPCDWEPFGAAGIERLQAFRRQPCFSHDELLLTAVARDNSIKTAQWLSKAVSRLRWREEERRAEFRRRHELSYPHRCELDAAAAEEEEEEEGEERTKVSECRLGFAVGPDVVPEEESRCSRCKCYVYLSRFVCHRSSRTLCLAHAGSYECCDATEEERFRGAGHSLRYRVSDKDLAFYEQRVGDRAKEPEAWAEKLNAALTNDEKPGLKSLRSLVGEGERIAYELPQLPDLKLYVERCNDWVERAMNYIVRKQQNRRKNEKAWRKGNSVRAAEMEERDRELRRVENIARLLDEAKDLGFTCPEISQLEARAEAIELFQRNARQALHDSKLPTSYVEELVEAGRAFNVDMPELDRLDRHLQQKRWYDQAEERRRRITTLQDAADFIREGQVLDVPEQNEHLVWLREQIKAGELWEAKAKELILADTVHYQQLEALFRQASTLPVSKETLADVDQIMNKQREAQRQVLALYERSQHADMRQRPRYKDVRHLMEELAELNSKPEGTLDLEREQKRHEDWMRKGKKLFGKANAPLHILLVHMGYVDQRNQACFNTKDVPRAPAEPSSREHTPGHAGSSSPSPSSSSRLDGPNRERDVFCLCRQPESGMMIECELCHEWYHGKCLKIARGKVKDEDKYTCPICDWTVKIPRDAARPKLEDLQEWHAEMPQLPFQPDEEECLNRIVHTAQAFRDFVRPYINPVVATPEEVPTQRFYLRKIEGAEILLADETNFFRQELHRWAPVAPEPPPLLEHSLSTRKPRPTKQQKLMAQFGVDSPDELPQEYRTKAHSFNRRKSSDQYGRPAGTFIGQLGPAGPSTPTSPTAGHFGGRSAGASGRHGSLGYPTMHQPDPIESTFTYKGFLRLTTLDVDEPAPPLPRMEYAGASRNGLGSPTSPADVPLPPLASAFNHYGTPVHPDIDPNSSTFMNGNDYGAAAADGRHNGMRPQRPSMDDASARSSAYGVDLVVGDAHDDMDVDNSADDDKDHSGNSGNMDSIFANLTNQDAMLVESSPPPPGPRAGYEAAAEAGGDEQGADGPGDRHEDPERRAGGGVEADLMDLDHDHGPEHGHGLDLEREREQEQEQERELSQSAKAKAAAHVAQVALAVTDAVGRDMMTAKHMDQSTMA